MIRTPSGHAAQELTVKQRLNKAILDFSSQLAQGSSAAHGGALVQCWMPEQASDGTCVLSAQGLPFAVAGIGDLLALFRCVSVRYRFSTDIMKPALMGAIGRVYATRQPEMSHDVQQYDKQVYLRVSEAQRCQVHSSLMVPVFSPSQPHEKPVAVFELVQSDKDVAFPAIMSWLKHCLEVVQLRVPDVHQMASISGLRKWPMHVDQQLGQDAAISNHFLAACTSSLSPPSLPPASKNKSCKIEEVSDGPAASGRHATATTSAGSPNVHHAEAWQQQQQQQQQQAGDTRHSSQAATPTAHSPVTDGAPGQPPGSSHPASEQDQAMTSSVPGQAASTQSLQNGSASSDNGQAQQLMAWMAQNGLGPEALQTLKSILQQGPGHQAQAPAAHQASAAPAGAPAVSTSQPATTHALPQRQPSSTAQNKSLQPSGMSSMAAAAGQAHEEAEDEDFSSDAEDVGDSDNDDDINSKKAGGNRLPNNRIGGGAGKRLRFEDLQSQFGLGLKEAAANLGICATTLKRACRRHGIKRWPRRQIVKLSKALTQMGYQGMPPSAIVQTAMTGHLPAADSNQPPNHPNLASFNTFMLAQQGQQQMSTVGIMPHPLPNNLAQLPVMQPQQGLPQQKPLQAPSGHVMRQHMPLMPTMDLGPSFGSSGNAGGQPPMPWMYNNDGRNNASIAAAAGSFSAPSRPAAHSFTTSQGLVPPGHFPQHQIPEAQMLSTISLPHDFLEAMDGTSSAMAPPGLPGNSNAQLTGLHNLFKNNAMNENFMDLLSDDMHLLHD